MSQESFQREFNALREMGEETFVLRGSTIIVEVLPPEEIKTAGGIVLATSSDQQKGNSINAGRVDVGRVLMTGPGYWDEDLYEDLPVTHAGGYVALEVNPGAIVLLAKFTTDYISHFPGIQRPTGSKLALIKMDSVLAYYPTQEAYERAKKALNS